jgi:hypothetical protein
MFIKKKCCQVECIIGNNKYPSGFNENALSSFQMITDDKYLYVYSLSDFLYQILSFNNLKTKNLNINNLLLLLLQIRELIANLDITGSKIYKINKNNYDEISTILGYPSQNTINQSEINNGYNNFLNVYIWCATKLENELYFGTLDLRTILYTSLVEIIVNLFPNIENLKEILLNLPEDIIIIIIEIVFNKYLSLPIDLENKQLYFDIIKYKNNEFSKITSNGFVNTGYLNEYGDAGCRNLNIIKNKNGTFLLIGTTCYQITNYAKNWLLSLN